MKNSEIDNIIETADRRAVFCNQVEHARKKYHSLNILYWEGHSFTITRELLCYVALHYQNTIVGSALHGMPEPTISHIILDDNAEPVMIEDLADFLERLEECHTEALNQYHDTYLKLQAAKTTKELIQVT